MKPRTRTERELVELAGILPPPGPEVLEHAKGLFKKVAYYRQHRGNRQEVWCQCCGYREPCDTWLVMSMDHAWTCPECGAVCMLKNWNDKGSYTPETTSLYLSVVDVYKDWQLVRTFEVFRENDKKGGRTEYGMLERYQNWVTEKGKEIVTSRRYSRGRNFMHWENGGYVIQHHNGHCNGYYNYEDLYDVSENYIYPKMKLLPALRRKGLNMALLRIFFLSGKYYPVDVMSKWLRTPYFETLWKQGERGLFRHFSRERRRLEDYWDSIKVARRHGYAFKDIDMWLDYIDELKVLKLDTHSPHYLCPVDLQAAHAETSRRVMRKRNAEAMLAERKRIADEESKYNQHVRPFLDIRLQGYGIVITCLPTVQDVFEEGEKMHHCIYRMGYHRKKDSLLMSARDEQTGERIESIEVDLREFNVLQSRGLQNMDTERHEDILRLIQIGMEKIRNAKMANYGTGY